MTDLISRQAAKAIKVLPKCYRNYQTNNLDDAYEKGWEDALFSLNALPTIDPVKHGRWIEETDGGAFTQMWCSECGSVVYSTNGFHLTGIKYCPFCGVRLDEEDKSKEIVSYRNDGSAVWDAIRNWR